MPIPQPTGMTTSSFKNKGFRCAKCHEFKAVVSIGSEGQVCDDCQPEGFESLVQPAED